MTAEACTATIVAACTAPGRGVISLVRLSGPEAHRITRALLSTTPSEPHGHGSFSRALLSITLHDGRISAPSTPVPSWVAWMNPPHTYTTEPVVEIILPGSPPLLRAVLRACVDEGARHAEPGEFTYRAFLNGRLDLGQAESVERVVGAANESERRAALSRLTGETATAVHALRDGLVQTAAALEACLDFEEEELDPETEAAIPRTLQELAARCRVVAGEAAPYRPATEGIPLRFVGVANAGKSSLVNALLGTEAVITSDRPSTTRDRLSHPLRMGRFTYILEDGPGLDLSGSEVAAATRDHATGLVRSATHLALVVDGSRPVDAGLRALIGHLPDARLLLVINKSDSPQVLEVSELEHRLEGVARSPSSTVHVSATTGAGVEDLRALLAAEAFGEAGSAWAGQVTVREAGELRETANHLDQARQALSAGDELELIAEELRLAHGALNRALGFGYADAILENIFSRFCIGK